MLCFDLENVITCPKAEISSFFYNSKLNVYNLTAHLSTNEKVCCSIWNESLMVSNENDIASALIRILDTALNENPDFKQIFCRVIPASHKTEIHLWRMLLWTLCDHTQI